VPAQAPVDQPRSGQAQAPVDKQRSVTAQALVDNQRPVQAQAPVDQPCTCTTSTASCRPAMYTSIKGAPVDQSPIEPAQAHVQ
jgi:hypothetical protein